MQKLITIAEYERIVNELREIKNLEQFRDVQGEEFCKKNKITFGQLNFLVSVICAERTKSNQ